MDNNDVFVKPGAVEYQMSKEMAEELAAASGKSKKRLNLQEYLVDYVNRECGLLRQCTKVSIV